MKIDSLSVMHQTPVTKPASFFKVFICRNEIGREDYYTYRNLLLLLS